MTAPPPVSLAALFMVFVRLGAFSFGGGLTGWVYREVVQQRQWLTETDFLSGLAVSQILPGANVTNLAVYVGQRLRGNVGSLVAFIGILIVPFFAIIGMVTAYEQISGTTVVDAATDGITAAAVGLLILTAWRSGARSVKSVHGTVALVATFVTVGVLRWPLLPVVLCIAPLSVAAAWWWRKPDAG